MEKLVRLTPSEIIVTDRKRSVTDIEELAKSIQVIGLIEPLVVDEDKVLISGYHRLEACKKIGMDEIPVVIKTGLDKLQAELAEIDENLIRKNLTVLQRADQLLRKKQIYEILQPESRPEEQRKKGLNVSNEIISSLEECETFTDNVAKVTNKTPRSIQMDILIASNISKEIKAEIIGTEIEDNKTDLLQLARIKDPTQQKEIIAQVKAGEFRSVKSAVKAKKDGLKPEVQPIDNTITHIDTELSGEEKLAYDELSQKYEELKMKYKSLLDENESLKLEIKQLKKAGNVQTQNKPLDIISMPDSQDNNPDSQDNNNVVHKNESNKKIYDENGYLIRPIPNENGKPENYVCKEKRYIVIKGYKIPISQGISIDSPAETYLRVIAIKRAANDWGLSLND